VLACNHHLQSICNRHAKAISADFAVDRDSVCCIFNHHQRKKHVNRAFVVRLEACMATTAISPERRRDDALPDRRGGSYE